LLSYYFTSLKKLFDANLALIVTAITIAQPNFFAQSAIALPEMSLTLWAVLTIYHFVVGNRAYCFLFGTLMMLTKESGLAIIAALMIYQFICFLNEKITRTSIKSLIQNLLFASLPLFVFAGFLLIQHHQRGYYFFPEHMAMLKHDWEKFQDTLRHCYDILFDYQGRTFITWSFLITFVLFYKPIPLAIRCLIVLSLMVCVKVFFRFWHMPNWFTLSLLVAVTTAYYYFMHIKYSNNLKNGDRALALSFIVGVVYLIFSSLNFFTNRYLFILTPFTVLYLTYYIRESLLFNPSMVYYWATVIIAIAVYNGLNYGTFQNGGDDSPKYIDAVKLERTMVNYMEQHHLQKNKVYCNFTMSIALKDKGAGYISLDTCFSNAGGILDTNTEYALYSNVDYDTLWGGKPIALPNFYILKKFDYGIAHGIVFKRI
jgi:hypothetical protein